jgi:hypothetical protein
VIVYEKRKAGVCDAVVTGSQIWFEAQNLRLIEVVNEVITNYKQIKHTMKEWEHRQQMADGKVSQLEGEHRKSNILIFYWKRGRTWDTLHTRSGDEGSERVNEAGDIEWKHSLCDQTGKKESTAHFNEICFLSETEGAKKY